MNDSTTEAEAVARLVTDNIAAGPISVAGVPSGGAVLIPEGFTLADTKRIIDAFRERPERKTGCADLADIDSLIAHAKRTAVNGASAVFADATRNRVTVIYDYDHAQSKDADPGAPGWRHHSASVTMKPSAEFVAWTSGQPMTQAQFGEFIDERGASLMLPPDGVEADPDDPSVRFGKPSEIRATAKAFRLHTKQSIEASEGPGGNVSVSFLSENMTREGRPIDVPSAFWIVIPLFEGEEDSPTPVRVRLRFKTEQSGNTSVVKWTMKCEGAQRLFAQKFRERAQRVCAETGLPVFFGQAEK